MNDAEMADVTREQGKQVNSSPAGRKSGRISNEGGVTADSLQIRQAARHPIYALPQNQRCSAAGCLPDMACQDRC